MAFDGLFTKSMVAELDTNLTGGRINKIYQPSKNEVLISVRANGKNHRLLLCAHSSYARVQITSEQIDTPNEPPMFCMLLRKHLEGFTIESITQPNLERIVIINVKGRNEIGDLTYKQLIIEIMGKHSNIILVDSTRGKILDCIKHVPAAMNSVRTLLPGCEYVYPPKQDKLNPFEEVADCGEFSPKWLVDTYAGVSPYFAKRLVSVEEFNQYIAKLAAGDITPSLIREDRESFYLWSFEALATTFKSLGELLDRYYFGKAERDRVKQQTHDLERHLQNEKDKNEKKLVKLQASLDDTERADDFKKKGELLTANLYALKKGMNKAQVVDYYDENQGEITITLDPRKTPNENAQSYFTKYQKAKKSILHLEGQIEITNQEIEYLENVIHQLEAATPSDIQEIREELVSEKYLKAKFTKKKKATAKPTLERYVATDGTEILVGKNNIQNEYLTMKLASRFHTWLHTKDIPGSHVVILSDSPSNETILEAAILSAYFSKARESNQVPVDYTLIKHVKKPSGAKPGFVNYFHQKTVYASPSVEKVREMLK